MKVTCRLRLGICCTRRHFRGCYDILEGRAIGSVVVAQECHTVIVFEEHDIIRSEELAF